MKTRRKKNKNNRTIKLMKNKFNQANNRKLMVKSYKRNNIMMNKMVMSKIQQMNKFTLVKKMLDYMEKNLMNKKWKITKIKVMRRKKKSFSLCKIKQKVKRNKESNK